MSAAEGPEEALEAPESLEILIEQRICKLQNRRFLLQQMQQVIRRTDDRDGNAQHAGGDDEDVSELDLVERELEDLLQQKQKLLNEKHSTSSNGAQTSSILKTETPEGGVYTLPPLLLSPDVPPEPPEIPPPPAPPKEPVTRAPSPEPPPPEKQEPPEEEEEEEVEEETKQIEPVDSLSKMEAFTRCPSCHKVVLTQTKKFNGDSAWLMCCICSLMGGVVGFCFIPFCIDRTKSVRHLCPDCQATIYTYHPF